MKHGFRFNIQYLFIYLFKVMSTKAGGTDHLFLFTYGNELFLHMVFILIFSVYLFIYSKRCQQKQVEPITCFYLLMQIASSFTKFSFAYSVSICLFINWCQQKQVDLTFITACNEVGARLCFYMCLWFCPQLVAATETWNTYGCQVGATHPTGMLSCVLIQIGCCDLFLEFHI